MTTGRINQVTIDRQGGGCPPASASFGRTLAIALDSDTAMPSVPEGPSTSRRPISLFATSFQPFTLASSGAYPTHARWRGMPGSCVGEEPFFRISDSSLGQRPWRTTTIVALVVCAADDSAPRSAISLGQPVGSTRLASLASKCPPVVPGTLGEQGLLLRTECGALSLLSVFPKACSLNKTANYLTPGHSPDTLAPFGQLSPFGHFRPQTLAPCILRHGELQAAGLALVHRRPVVFSLHFRTLGVVRPS